MAEKKLSNVYNSKPTQTVADLLHRLAAAPELAFCIAALKAKEQSDD